MVDQNGYDMRTSFFNERAEELAKNRQINTLHKMKLILSLLVKQS
jgi:hypothetical protein